MSILKKTKKFSWENASKSFQKDRIINVDIEQFKACGDAINLPYIPDDKQEDMIQMMIEEQARTLLYSFDMIMQKFSYVEKVGDLKFSDEDQSRQYCFGLLCSQPSWKSNFALFGNDMGCHGNTSDIFPYVNDEWEKLFWNDGSIASYLLPADDLENGVILDREIVFDALRAVYERNKALLQYKLSRALIKSKIREI